MLDLLLSLQRSRDMAMVVVTHDPAVIARCPQCLHVVDGRIVRDEAAPSVGAG